MSSVPERSDIEDQYKWRLDSLFVDDQSWESAFTDVESRVEDLRSYEGTTTESAETLAIFLDEYETVMRDVADVSAYARLRRDEDTRESKTQAMASRARSLVADASSATSFLEPELQSLEEADIEAMIADQPALGEFEHYFDDILRLKPHTRSSEVENLLAELSEVTGAPGDIVNMLRDADMEFPVVEMPDGEDKQITQNNFVVLLKNPDREFRREVYTSYYDEWLQVRNAVATAYQNNVKTNVKLARARRYDSAREAALSGPNVSESVYDTLVDTVRDHLEFLHRHAELKRDVHDLEELRMWDLYVPLVTGDSPEIPYDEACEYVIEAVEPLGEPYQSRLAEGLDSRWVDVYETRGKRSGAYSSGTYDSQPYILMNYQDDVSSLFTLAHELGHSMHSELASESQPFVYSSYTILIAEIASTVNETLLTHYLLENVDDERLHRHVLNEYLERFRSTLYRQTMFAEFEHRIHRRSEDGHALTADRIDDLFTDLKGDYYEPAKLDDWIAAEWMRIPHFYRAFYVYQYATGIASAVALVERIREEGQPAAERYLDLLRSGSHGYPLDLLAEAGIDLTEPEPVAAALSVYDTYLDEFTQVCKL